MTKKCGLLTFNYIDIKIDLIFSEVSVRPFKVYFDLPSVIDLYIVTRSKSLNIGTDTDLFELSKTRVTVALVIPALPCL